MTLITENTGGLSDIAVDTAPAIRVRHLWHRFGRFDVLRDVSFDVHAGEIFGFIGPNGAGKTTTIRIMATLLEPLAGRVEIDGLDVTIDPDRVRRIIGYMPDHAGVYERVTVREYLEFFADAYGVPTAGTSYAVVDAVMELTDLLKLQDKLVATMSKGMKQRLQLARTLLHDPKVLILDEPASDLDPRARIEIRDLLVELQSMGKTIFLSSHILTELADVCTSVAILERGRLVVAGPIDDIARRLEEAQAARDAALPPEQRQDARPAWYQAPSPYTASQSHAGAGAAGPGGAHAGWAHGSAQPHYGPGGYPSPQHARPAGQVHATAPLHGMTGARAAAPGAAAATAAQGSGSPQTAQPTASAPPAASGQPPAASSPPAAAAVQPSATPPEGAQSSAGAAPEPGAEPTTRGHTALMPERHAERGQTTAAAQRIATRRSVKMRTLQPGEQVAAALAGLESVTRVAPGPQGTIVVQFYGDDNALGQIVSTLVAANIAVIGLEPERNELERIFLEVTKGEVQ